MDAVGDVGVSRLADGDDPTVADSDVGLDHAPVVEDHRAGDDEIGRALGSGGHRLAHRLADDLAAPEDGLVAGPAAVLGDLDEEVGVRQADAVADRRAEERDVALAAERRSRPVLGRRAVPRRGRAARRPLRRPASGTSPTSRSMPGSKRTEVPAGNRQPQAPCGSRSNDEGEVRLGEVEVRADLDRAVAGVHHHRERWRSSPRSTGDWRGGSRPGRCHRRSPSGTAAGDGLPAGADAPSRDRLVDGHELRPVGERRLDLNLGDELGDALHHVVAREHARAPTRRARRRRARPGHPRARTR